MTHLITEPEKRKIPWERVAQFVISAIMAVGILVLIWVARENSKLVTQLINELH